MNSTNQLPDPLVTEFSPETIEARLGFLMRWYLRQRTTNLTRAIVQYIEALLAHPKFDAHYEQRCVYRRLARQWRFLGAEVNTSGKSSG